MKALFVVSRASRLLIIPTDESPQTSCGQTQTTSRTGQSAPAVQAGFSAVA